jgi:hypothetical protein
MGADVALPNKDQLGGGVIDTMIDFPFADKREVYAFLRSQLHDSESLDDFDFPVEYMFKGVPDALAEGQDPVAVTLGAMDRFGIEYGLVGMDGDHQQRALREHPDRFLASMSADANEGMEAVRKIRRAHDEFDLRAVVTFPAGTDPQVPIDGARWYPIYATCAELGLPVFICSGVPGPRVPMLAQHVELLDTVCYDFPRADHRDPPRLRTVGGACGQADDQVAQPALLHLGIRSEALPPGHHRLRQHPRRRQGAVTRATTRWAYPSSASLTSSREWASTTTCGPSFCGATRPESWG